MAYSDQKILDAALELFNQGEITPQREPVSLPADPEAPDLSKFDLSESQINAMLSGKPLLQQKELLNQPKAPKPVIQEEKTFEELLKEFNDVVGQAVKLLKEMTSCGMIGTSSAPPKKVKKKTTPIKQKKRTAKDILKDYLP